MDDRQFPRDELESRREFLRTCHCLFSKVAIAATFAPVIAACEFSVVHSSAPSGPVLRSIVVDVSSLSDEGSALVTAERGPDRAPIVVVRRSTSDYIAMSMLCTHSQFVLRPPSAGTMYCPGHGSDFNLEGAPLDGPAVATGPLKRYPTTFDPSTSRLTITLS
jgi:Rieske Fe-S protein